MAWEAAAIAAGAKLAGTYMQNQAAKSSAKDKMSFQERMSNTAYQRGMEDMRKAGLNPMLAYQMGGATTPTGAQYQPGNYGEAADTAVAAYNVASQDDLRDSQEEKIDQEIKQMKELHGERWERLFATMGPENILASVQAVLAGVNVKQVLQNARPKTSITTLDALKDFMNMVRANKNWISSNQAGFFDSLNRFLPDKYKLTPETIAKVLGDGNE